MAFPRQRVAVFVDGCFWHSCPEHCHVPKTNTEWWVWKLARNVARDRDTDRHLEEMGWSVVRLWEHEDVLDMVNAVVAALTQDGCHT